VAIENPKYQDVSMRDELWQVICEAMNSYMYVAAHKLHASCKDVWLNPEMIRDLGELAEAVSKVFDLHLLDTRVPLIQTFFRGVSTLLLRHPIQFCRAGCGFGSIQDLRWLL
jgi:hypothetical protein